MQAKLLTSAITLLCLIQLNGCREETPQTTVANEPRPALIYQLPDASSGQLRSFPARVDAANEAVLSFRVAGNLSELPVKAGQAVKQGDVLARLDNHDYQLQLDDRQARFQLADSQFKRINDLYNQRQISRAQFDQAQADLNISRAALDSALSSLNYTRLSAPFDGTVAEVMVDNHQTIAAGSPVLTLQTRDQLVVRIQLPEQLMARLGEQSRPYQPEVEFEALPGQRFKTTYQSHNTKADAATGSYLVELRMQRPAELNLLPGMSATVFADIDEATGAHHTVPVVPPQAVFQSSDQTAGSGNASVWLLDEQNRLQARVVTTGQLTDAGLEITSGLQAGDRILAAGVHQAQAGMTVKPWTRERGL